MNPTPFHSYSLNSGKSISKPRKFANWISSPHPSIQEPERRRRIHLLSWLLMILILAGLSFIIISLFSNKLVSENVFIGSVDLFALSIAYVFSRTRYYKISAALAMFAIWGSVLVGSFINQDVGSLHYVIIAVLLGSMFLSPRTSAITSTVILATILLLPVVSSVFPFTKILSEAFLIGIAGVLATVASMIQHQDFIHIKHQSEELANDMIELKHSQAALEKSEARLKLQVSRMPIACIFWNAKSQVVSWNPSAEKIFGFSEKEAIGSLSYDMLVSKNTNQTGNEFWGSILEGDRTIQSVNENQTKNGQTIICEWSNTPLRESNGDIIGILSMVQDITEKKLAEQLKISSEARYHEIFNRIPVAMYRTSAEGRILETNPAMVDLLGYPDQKTFLETNAFDAFVRTPDRFEKKNQIEKEGIVQSFRLQLYRYDGRRIWARDRMHIVKDGNVTLYEGSLEDITEQVEAEEQILQSTFHTQSLAEISRLIAEVGLNHQAVLDTVTLRVTELIGDACIITLLNDNGHQLKLASIYHSHPEAVEHIRGLITSSTNGGSAGIPEFITLTNQPFLIEEVSQDRITGNSSQDRPSLGRFGVYSLLIVPLRAQGRVIGSIGVIRDHPGQPYKNDDQVFLQDIADRTSLAIINAQLFERAHRNLNKVETLRLIDIAITGSLDLRVSLGIIIDQVMAHTGVDAANILVFNRYNYTFDFAAGKGFRTKALQNTHIRLGEGFAGRAALERKTLSIPDLRTRGTDLLRSPDFLAESFVAYYAVPLVALGQVKGVLEIFHRSPLQPDREWVDFLEALAGQAAIAIDSVNLFNDLQRSNQELISAYDATILGWSHALDLRDEETEGHTQRVADLTLRLARSMGVNEALLVHVRRGALLHDIGKMGIPDRILLKPGPLTDKEWVVMRKHPVYAYEMLAPIFYLKPALDIPYCHHEKWDGTGYPRGLVGENIPLAARIFTVVDVWDALTSDRPYRPAWSKEKVTEYIQGLAGKYFDPVVVDAFLSLINKENSNLD